MKILNTTLFCLLALSLTAQEDVTPLVAKSISSIQANLGALHFVHERGLSDNISLRLEVGVHQQFRYLWPETSPRGSYYGLRPVIGVGGRYYYNLAKRAEKGKRTTNNSGNFVELIGQYRPDFFVYNTNENINAVHTFSSTARWGLRRQLGKHFDVEFTAGVILRPGGSLLGRRSIFGTGLPHLGWRFGYRF